MVSSDCEYGEAVSAPFRLAPSNLNCTPVTPTLSDALAVTVTVPETVLRVVGEVTEIVGAVVSVPPIEIAMLAVAELPEKSVATAVKVWGPFAKDAGLSVVV